MQPITRLIAVLLSSFALILGGATPAHALDGPVLLADHPDISDVTESSNNIQDLGVEGDRVYIGHGDYGTNTGPVAVAWANLWGTAMGSNYSYPGEQIDTFRNDGGRLLIPNIDPRGSGPGGYGTTSGYVAATPQVHTFDATRFAGALYLVGADYDGATRGASVYRSADNGATWSRVLAVTDNPYTGYERFYYIATASGKLFVQARHKGYDPSNPIIVSGSDLFPLMSSSDGLRWSKANSRASLGPIGSGHSVESFAGRMWSTGGKVSDGSRAVASGLPHNVRDLFVAGDRLYAITIDGTVLFTTGSTTWTVLPGKAVPAGVNALSIAVAGGRVIAGDDAGRLWATTL